MAIIDEKSIDVMTDALTKLERENPEYRWMIFVGDLTTRMVISKRGTPGVLYSDLELPAAKKTVDDKRSYAKEQALALLARYQAAEKEGK